MTIELAFFHENHLPPREVEVAVKDLDDQEFPWPWSSTQWVELFKDMHNHHLYTVHINSNLVGFALFQVSIPDNSSHLLKILILTPYRKRGLAWDLLSYCTEQLIQLSITSIYLEVEESNTRAIELYKKFGLKQIHSKERFYSNGSTAVIMQKLIIPALANT